MHIHLDPVGGVAGDMFAAALLDLRPDLEAPLRAALADAGFSAIATVAREAHNDGVLTGSRFVVSASHAEAHGHHHRHYNAIVALFNDASMDEAVRARALEVFRLLGEAEAEVHGKALAEVAFHEVGAWDSIADVMAAAWLIEALGVTSWSCSALPIGGGRVNTAHGELAIPAPATTLLLRGFPMHDDGRSGERVTPTGAAILKHVAPRFDTLDAPMTLLGTGSGFGTRKLRGMSNVLRALSFAAATGAAAAQITQTLNVCEFEIDDQSAEDLAVALDVLRALPGVLDVIQAPVMAKKGRLATHVRVLMVPEARDSVIGACLAQTSTLGVRWHAVQRASVPREEFVTTVGSSEQARAVRVKQATRPGGGFTRKAEMDDLAQLGSNRAEREQLRRDAESLHAVRDDNGTDHD